MHLFAEASGSNAVGTIIGIMLMMLGVRKICSFLSGSKTARDTAKHGGLAILRNLFK
jgi:hypothetical protein